MLSTDDILKYGMSILCGKDSNICLIDFISLYPNLSLTIKKKHQDFRDELIRRFSLYSQDFQNHKNIRCKWTLEIISSEIIENVIHFNRDLKSMPESHRLIYVCLDNEVLPHEQASLQCSYPDSEFFQFDLNCLNSNYEIIFKYIQRKKLKKPCEKKLINFYPLLLHVNSISSGLVFNYFFSYLNRQIGSTNNISIRLTFDKDLNYELFPSNVNVIINSLIENIFLDNCPSTIDYDHVIPIQSKILSFQFDSTKFQSFDGTKTLVTYSINGINDFGSILQTIHIYQQNLKIDHLIFIEIEDDVRQWNQQYRKVSYKYGENQRTNIVFEDENDRTKKCHFLSMDNLPSGYEGHQGLSTMKKTTKDCYELYIQDPQNHLTDYGKQISKILVVPVYFLIMPSSCQFEPTNLNELIEEYPNIVKGTIIDPDQPNRIRLARVNDDVLRSPAMIHFNRYLRRTFYYFDHIDQNNEIIRYLFCAEYPYILSILDQLERTGQISSIQKCDEYFRFCNMLNRLIESNHLSDSIQLIQINDQFNQDADFKPLTQQIKEHIDQYYQLALLSADEQISSTFIDSQIIDYKPTDQVSLFFTDKAKENQSIYTLINDIKTKLEHHDYIVEDIHANLDSIEKEKQILFICTGKKNEKINRSIINAIQAKINKYGVLRDVFILINEAIQYFPCRFIESIPYLSFDLNKRPAYLNPEDIQEIIYYLTNMNVLSHNYTNTFEDINQLLKKSPLQCTSIGEGCAAAFYYNYVKLLIPLADHQNRIKLINEELRKENLLDNKRIFVQKWIFVIPSTIQNTNKIISSALAINKDEQKTIGFQLSLWKPKNPKFESSIFVTIGGVYKRSYSNLTIYKLTNLRDDKSYYFPMEIPAALHGLQNQYDNILSHFNFGKFDPIKQGSIFQTKVKEYFSNDQEQYFHENLLLIPIDNSQIPNSINNIQQTEILLENLWKNICETNQLSD